MRSLQLVGIALALLLSALADGGTTPRDVDLRAPHALEQLHHANPGHFEKIQQMLAGLRDEPKRVEGDWLQVNFDVRDVGLSRQLIRTSNPPKQLLRFTLDDVRYVMYVARPDLSATVVPVK